MQNKYPIKTDLFRFITTRTPDQLTQEDISSRFITHPDISESRIDTLPATGVDQSVFQDYLDTYEAVTNYKEIRAISPILYDSTSVFMRNRSKLIHRIPKELENPEEYLLTPEQLIWMWDQLFYQVITRNSSYVRQAAIQMILGDYILKKWIEENAEEPEMPENPENPVAIVENKDFSKLRLLIEAKIVIPQELIEFIRDWYYLECGGGLKGVNSLGIADFRKVEQEVCCYVPGEVSHIENVMAKEYKERSTRNLVRSEQTIEVSKEIEVENLTDVTTATRNEISTEISSVIDEMKNSNYGGSVGVSAKYMKAQIDVDAYADFANSNSSSFANSTAKTYAEEITKRALERIVQKTTEKRTSTIIKEFEENNKHGFDNRLGVKHVTGIYRWVDIIYKNRLVNYGKRLMIEFMIPEPAEFYKRVQKYKPEGRDTETDNPEPPKALADFGINSYTDINSENAFNAGAYFGVSVNELKAAEISLTKSLTAVAPIKHERFTQSQNLIAITVDPDYEADTILGSYTYEYRANSGTSAAQAFCNFSFGGKIVSSGGDYASTKTNKTVAINIDFVPDLGGNIPVSVSYSGVFGFYGAVTIKCVLKQSIINGWKNDIYNNLLNAYNQKLAQYESEILDSEMDDSQMETKESNPEFNRIVEQRELKRACIEMITKPFCRKQGEKFYEDINACDKYMIPKVKQNAAFEEYASQVKFFEQAFDWSLISYLFYPYYWADKCDWADLMQSENTDTIFQAFLQAGMARVVVPVRPQFNQAVMYYLETGDIWLGGDLVPGTENDLYLSIADELAQTEEELVEEEWETRVPTSLAIVQDKSAKLEEEGLPCCHKVDDEYTTNIRESDEILGNIVPVEPT